MQSSHVIFRFVSLFALCAMVTFTLCDYARRDSAAAANAAKNRRRDAESVLYCSHLQRYNA